MSDTPKSVPDELQVLAGEYVLGVLDIAEMRAVRRRAMADPGFAAVINGWERKLAPMVAALRPVPPPDALWARIEQAVAPLPDETDSEAAVAEPAPTVRPVVAQPSVLPLTPRPTIVSPAIEPPLVPRLRAATAQAARRPRLWPWKLATLGSLALAAGVAAIALLPNVASRLGVPNGIIRGAPTQIAALMPPGSGTAGFLAAAQPDGTVVLTALATVAVPSGRDLELWVLPPGAKTPASLGVLPAAGRRVTLPGMPAKGTQLLVSVEPLGGSPSGAPTGAVVYAGSFGQLSL